MRAKPGRPRKHGIGEGRSLLCDQNGKDLQDFIRPEYVTTRTAATLAGMTAGAFDQSLHRTRIGTSKSPTPLPIYQQPGVLTLFVRSEIEAWALTYDARKGPRPGQPLRRADRTT